MTDELAPTRSHHPQLIRRAALACAAGAAALIAALGQALPANAEPSTTQFESAGIQAEPVGIQSEEWTKTWTQTMLAGEPFQEVRKELCPAGMRLEPHNYHKGSGWIVPYGLEITQSNPLFDAVIAGHAADGFVGGPAVGVGGFGSTVSNWFGAAQTVTYTIHCVAD